MGTLTDKNFRDQQLQDGHKCSVAGLKHGPAVAHTHVAQRGFEAVQHPAPDGRNV